MEVGSSLLVTCKLSQDHMTHGQYDESKRSTPDERIIYSNLDELESVGKLAQMGHPIGLQTCPLGYKPHLKHQTQAPGLLVGLCMKRHVQPEPRHWTPRLRCMGWIKPRSDRG